MISILFLMYFGRPRHGHTIEKLITFQTVDSDIFLLSFDFLEKGLGLISPTHFVNDFLRKNLSCYILSTDQISLSICLYFLRY